MRAAILVCGVLTFAPTAHGQNKMVELNSIRLYLPDDLLRQRLGDDVTPLADYMKALQQKLGEFWAKGEYEKAKGLFVAVGVKPNQRVRVWCDAVDGEIPPETLAKLEKTLADVPSVAVKNGPIAFALEVKLGGQTPEKFPVFPNVWTDAAKASKQPLMVPDVMFKAVWAD
jgi:hypothetical protein